MIYQLCHIVLGLQPLNRQAEGEIVRGWLDREEKAPLAGKYNISIFFKIFQIKKTYISSKINFYFLKYFQLAKHGTF